MHYNKLKLYIVLTIMFFSCFNITKASVIINEVGLNPTENRFIELYNSGSSAVDLTNWYIQRKTATGSAFGSLVSKTYFEGIEIKANGYLLISKTSLNNSNVIVENLTLTESNIIQIKNSNQEVVDSLEWGSIPEGKSFQKVSGDFVIGNPTPGGVNKDSGILNDTDENDEESEEGGGNVASSTKKNEEKVIRTINAKIITPTIVFEGIPFKINSLITTNKKETLVIGKFKWNFGDGSTREDTSSNPFEHIYFYPGEYVLSLDYFERRSSTVDDSDRIIIKVVPREILISSVGDSKDPFIEIENKSNYEIVLSGWIITAGTHYFKIPDGTVLLANKKVRFSGRVTGFIALDLVNIIITNSKGEIMTSYPEVKIYPKKIVNISNNDFQKKEIILEEIINEDSNIINLNNLGASTINSHKINFSNYAYWGLGVIIIIGITSVLLLRLKNKDEIGYLEDDIRAEDIRIME